MTSGHSSLYASHKQKKIIACLYPLYGILASVGNDETLMFWDINKKTCLTSKNLGTQATCLDFSPDGRHLAIGLNNGVFMVLESYIERLSYGTYLEDYVMPMLSVIMCPKESNSSVVNIKYSFRGDFLAVSYNNEFKLQDRLDEAERTDKDNPVSAMSMGNVGDKNQYKDEKREPSFALLFVNR